MIFNLDLGCPPGGLKGSFCRSTICGQAKFRGMLYKIEHLGQLSKVPTDTSNISMKLFFTFHLGSCHFIYLSFCDWISYHKVVGSILFFWILSCAFSIFLSQCWNSVQMVPLIKSFFHCNELFPENYVLFMQQKLHNLFNWLIYTGAELLYTVIFGSFSWECTFIDVTLVHLTFAEEVLIPWCNWKDCSGSGKEKCSSWA